MSSLNNKILCFVAFSTRWIKVRNEKYVSSVSSVDVDLKPRSYYSKYYSKISNTKYRIDLKGERDFLLSKYLGFYLHYDSSDQEIGMDNINLFIILLRLKKI